MPAATITKNVIPVTGVNLTDASYTTLVAGSGNGITFLYTGNEFLVLLNDTGSSVTYTLKLRTFSQLSDYSITPANPTIVVPTGKTFLVKLSDQIQDPSTGYVTVECSGTGKARLVSLV